MQITFLGHSAVYIEHQDFAALIDPFLTGNPLAPYGPDGIPRLTHIFVTHGHGDHLGDTIALAKKHNALVIANAEIARFLSLEGLRTHGMHIGGRRTFDFGTVKLTPALHGSSIHTASGPVDGGNPCGFLLSIGGVHIYHAGDTGLTMDMQLLKSEAIDVAFLPIGGNYTMDIEDAIRAVGFIEPKEVVPMHYNTFDMIKVDPREFLKGVEAQYPLVVVTMLEPGETWGNS